MQLILLHVLQCEHLLFETLRRQLIITRSQSVTHEMLPNLLERCDDNW